MKAFRYDRATTANVAAKSLGEGDALLKANGIDLLDRMKERIDEPARVVTLVDVPGLDTIGRSESGGLRIGAMATLATLAASNDVRTSCPSLADAAGLAASPALRNRATVGGNLGQHTRCGYYRIKTFSCWKRGDDVCPVRQPGGVQETAGIFGNGSCASAHPSSLAPVLASLGATAVVVGKDGRERRIPVAELYEPPKRGKRSDWTLAPDDVVTFVEVPALAPGSDHAAYEEVRQKAAFDWALVSCAVWFVGGESAVKEARIWLGSVAPTPWRAAAAEKALTGKPFSAATAQAAADAATTGATPLPGNAYKVDLVRVVVRRALTAAWERRK